MNNKKPEKIFCWNCKTEQPYTLDERDVYRVVKGQSYKCKEKFATCNKCGCELSTTELDDENERLMEEYIKKHIHDYHHHHKPHHNHHGGEHETSKKFLNDCVIPTSDIQWVNGGNSKGYIIDDKGEFPICDVMIYEYPYIYLHGELETLCGYDSCVFYGKDVKLYIRRLIEDKYMTYSVSKIKLYHDGVYRDANLYLWKAKSNKSYDNEHREYRHHPHGMVRGLIVDATNFTDNEFAKEKMFKRPLII